MSSRSRSRSPSRRGRGRSATPPRRTTTTTTTSPSTTTTHDSFGNAWVKTLVLLAAPTLVQVLWAACDLDQCHVTTFVTTRVLNASSTWSDVGESLLGDVVSWRAVRWLTMWFAIQSFLRAVLPGRSCAVATCSATASSLDLRAQRRSRVSCATLVLGASRRFISLQFTMRIGSTLACSSAAHGRACAAIVALVSARLVSRARRAARSPRRASVAVSASARARC
jgi:hypothetical protein